MCRGGVVRTARTGRPRGVLLGRVPAPGEGRVERALRARLRAKSAQWYISTLAADVRVRERGAI